MPAARGFTSEEVLAAYDKAGGTYRGAARILGCDQATIRWHIQALAMKGEIDPSKILRGQNVGQLAEDIIKAQIELGLRSERKAKKGDWRKPSYIASVKHSVFMLGIFGDPHLDNPGADLDLFEEELYLEG